MHTNMEKNFLEEFVKKALEENEKKKTAKDEQFLKLKTKLFWEFFYKYPT